MNARMLFAGIVVAGLVVAACQPSGSAPAPVTPVPGGSPADPVAGAPAASPDGTPDLGSLRVPTSGWRTDFTRASVDLGDFRGGGPPRDGIPAVDAPAFESIDAARGWLTDQSPVVSLEVDGAARAYPLAILMWHEIVNDTLGGHPVVVTFCPLCSPLTWCSPTELIRARGIPEFGPTSGRRAELCHGSGIICAMRTTIDKAGRLVVPRPLRDRIGLAGGGEVELELDGAAIRIEPVGGSGLREDGGLLLIPASGAPLTAAAVRELIDADRHGR